MRILFYGINYYPELTGIGKYTGEAAEWLANKGHEVEVITAMPYYPKWQIDENYKNKLWHTENIKGVKVHRCPMYIPSKVTTLKRILLETSFALSSLRYWIPSIFKKRVDVVIGICPPFQLGFLTLLYGKLKNVPSIYHLQDLQVDMANDLGMIKNERFVNILFGLEKYLLNRMTIVSSISEGMIKKIKNKNLKHEQFWLFPNWVDTQAIKPLSIEESLRSELGYSNNDFIVQYSGTIAEKQGLEMIVEVAEDLPNIQFMLVGEGGYKEQLMKMVDEKQLRNIRFFPLQPYHKLANSLATGNVHLVLQKNSASDLVLPSKLTGILSAGACTIVTATKNSSLYDVITQHQAGIVIIPESIEALKTSILYAKNNDISIFKRNARIYAEKYLDREAIMSAFEKKLIEFVN